MGEVWKAVAGYEGSYEVSDLGRVRSIDRIASNGRFFPGLILKPGHDRGGYCKVVLSGGSVQKCKNVHVLVAEAFIEKKPGHTQVNHLNGDRRDNRKVNLEWCTQSENIRHSYDVLGRKATRLGGETAALYGKHGVEHPSSKPVIQILGVGYGAWFASAVCAQEFTGIHRSTITRVCRGKSKTAGGYRWVRL